MKVDEKVRMLRKVKSCSIGQLAAELDCARSTISRLESGRTRHASPEMEAKIEAAFKATCMN